MGESARISSAVTQAQRNAQRAVGQSLLQGAVQGAVVAVLQVLQLVAGRVRPKDAGTGQHTHMDGDIRHRGEIAGEGFCHQLRRESAGDGAQVVPDGVAMGGAKGGGAEAAVAVDDGGKALTQLRRAEARAEQRRVGVAVDVNKAGGNGPAGGVDNMSGGRCGQIADGGDPTAGNGHIGRKGGAARAVDDGAAPDKGIKHGLYLSPASLPSGAGRY